MTYDSQDTPYPGEAYEVSIPGTELTLSRVRQGEGWSRKLIKQDHDRGNADAEVDDQAMSQSEKLRFEGLEKARQSEREREERAGHDAFLAGKW